MLTHLLALSLMPLSLSLSHTCWLTHTPSLPHSLDHSLIHSLDVIDLLQPVQSVLDLQVNLGPLKMVPNDSPYPKNLELKKIRSLACLQAELLHEDVLDLLQPIHAVLDLQVNLGPLKMVSNDSPYPKTWG